MNHEIIDINIPKGEIHLSVSGDDLSKGADVKVLFDWAWSNDETERVAKYNGLFQIEFNERQGYKPAISEYVSSVVDEEWISSLINNQGEPMVNKKQAD
jgi:hypothetical protein